MLFGADDVEGTARTDPMAASIARWQIDQLRSALDGLGVASMAERQKVVEEIVGRPVAALSELSHEDVRPLLEGIHARKPKAESAGSAWDQRDEDTWIDRL